MPIDAKHEQRKTSSGRHITSDDRPTDPQPNLRPCKKKRPPLHLQLWQVPSFHRNSRGICPLCCKTYASSSVPARFHKKQRGLRPMSPDVALRLDQMASGRRRRGSPTCMRKGGNKRRYRRRRVSQRESTHSKQHDNRPNQIASGEREARQGTGHGNRAAGREWVGGALIERHP